MPRHISRPYDDWLTDDGSGYCPRCDTCFTGTQHNCEEVAAALEAQERRQAEADLYDAMAEAIDANSRALTALRELCAEVKKLLL